MTLEDEGSMLPRYGSGSFLQVQFRHPEHREVTTVKTGMSARLIIGVGLCLGTVILARHGMTVPDFTAALACVFASIWLAKQFGLTRAADHATAYELNLLARLDDPNPTVHKQAEIERQLYNLQQFRGSREAG